MTSPAPDEEARARLDRLMDQRRAELRMRWKDVAAKAGLTTEGLLGVRKGTGEIRALTKRGIEDALQWTPGSVERILDGGEPGVAASGDLRLSARAADPDADEKLQRAAELLAEATAMLEEIRRERKQGA